MLDQIIDKFNKKQAIIGIIGLGYVGLPLVLRFTEMGYKVLGIDIDPIKINKLNNGESYIKHIESDRIKKAVSLGFKAIIDFSELYRVDALIICVPTPLDNNRNPDLSYIKNTIDSFIPYLRKNQIISLESTTYPGTTEDELVLKIQKNGWVVGKDIFIVYSPEREDPGNRNFSVSNVPKVIGGYTKNCLEIGQSLYKSVIDTLIPVSNTRIAEMTKLFENIFRNVNIALVNEMKVLCHHMDIDIHEVIKAASTKPFGFMPFYPGPGLGGHCIPIDPFYLSYKAKEYDLSTRFIELAGEINSSMPYFVIQKISNALNAHKKSLNSSKILILGVSYKKNIDDDRESPSYKIMKLLEDAGVNVVYNDPYIPNLKPTRKYNFNCKSIDITKESLSDMDCVVIVSNHDIYDYDFILEHSSVIIDTCNSYPNWTEYKNKIYPS